MSTRTDAQAVRVLAMLCISTVFSILMLKQNMVNTLAIEQRALMVGASLQFETGHQIVERAFDQTYKQIVDRCRNHAEKEDPLSLMHCMQEIHTNDTTNVYPWWFETLLRDGSNGIQGPHGPWHFRTLKTPKKSVQFCNIEKVASTEWNVLKCRLDGHELGTDFCPEEPSQPSTLRAVFLRDPLERFLSAFRNKCLDAPYREGEGHCQPTEIFAPAEGKPERIHPPFPKAPLVEHLLKDKSIFFDAFVDTFPLKWNVHFYPSSLYCNGLYQTLGEYDFVGHMDSAFHDNLRAFGQRFGIGKAVSEVFNLVPKDGTITAYSNAHAQLKRNATASAHIPEYYTPRTLRRVLEYLSIDYSVHGLALPLPDWVDEVLAEEAQTRNM